MSELDRENLKQEERTRLVNDSEQVPANDAAAAKAKKKKIFIGVGILLLIGVILAIVLPLTLKGGSDDGINPITTPEYNPYAVDGTTIQATVFNQLFVIKAPA